MRLKIIFTRKSEKLLYFKSIYDVQQVKLMTNL